MNLPAITCFLSVARTGSLTDTARELLISRQAVSINIKKMEEEMGVPLFLPNCYPMRLTFAGRRIRAYYETFDYDLSAIRREFNPSSIDTVHSAMGWGSWLCPDQEFLDELVRRAASVGEEISIFQEQETSLLELLRLGKVSTIFCSQYLTSFIKEPYNKIIIGELPLYLEISSMHPLAQQGTVKQVVQELPYLTCRAAEETELEILNRVNREFVELKTMPPEIRILPNIESVYLHVMMGHGITCSPLKQFYNDTIKAIPLSRTVTQCVVRLNRAPVTSALWALLGKNGETLS